MPEFASDTHFAQKFDEVQAWAPDKNVEKKAFRERAIARFCLATSCESLIMRCLLGPVSDRDQLDLMRQITSILILVLCLGLGGCTTYGYKTAIGGQTYAPVDWHKVKLLFHEPTQPYEVIGVVSTQGGITASEGDMTRKLLKSAAELGADAVIVTGEGANQAILPGTTSTYGTANAYGNATATTYGNTTDVNGSATVNSSVTSYSSPTIVAGMPTNKGLAIKFSK